MEKRVSVVGIGKLGICFALNLEKNGYNVLGIDVNQDYCNLINDKKLVSDEPYVTEYLQSSKNLKATIDISLAVEADLIFIVVATPSLPFGDYDHSQIERVCNQLKSLGVQKKRKDLVICCTTMPTYCEGLHQEMIKYNFHVSYNPEFIAQGTIIKDQQNPDMVLIGATDDYAAGLLRQVYMDHVLNSPAFAIMSRTEAEICKLALNCFLTTKIAYANMVGDLLIKCGYSPNNVLKAIGSDSRIGDKYLRWGYGFGGPCFPRDNRAFGHFAEKMEVNPLICYATDKSNDEHLRNQLLFELENNKDKKKVFDYITYKPESTLLIESQQLKFAIMLAEYGFNVIIKERTSVIEEIKKTFTKEKLNNIKLIEN